MAFRASARIFANDHRVIEVSPHGWRLLSANGSGEEVLAEAAPGAALTYPADFGARLRLPESALQPGAIERVVLGWSASDETWHLGLILGPALAESRGSRWCGLARWHDPAAETHRGEASEASRALALTLARPLAIVPPRPGETKAQADADAAPPPSLPPLPYDLDEWTLTAPSENSLRFSLDAAWGRARTLRAAAYAVMAVAFLGLSIAGVTSGIMLPQPELLTWLGLASAAWLLILAIRTLVLASRQVRWIEVDGYEQVVRSDRWQLPVDQIDSVFASQVVKVQKRGTPADHVRFGELHLRLRNGGFQPILTRLRVDLKLPAAPPAPEDGSLARLTEYTAHTPLQAAAVRIARLIGVLAWDDRREE